jgi:hypothetical protein
MGHRTAAATILAALTMVGCGVQQHPYIVPASTHTSLGIVHGDEGAKAVVLDGPLTEPGDSGTLQGVLSADEAGCFTVHDHDGYTSTLVFPEGTRVHGPQVVILPDGTGVQLGSEVVLEGARIPGNDAASACLNHFRLFLVESAGQPA